MTYLARSPRSETRPLGGGRLKTARGDAYRRSYRPRYRSVAIARHLWLNGFEPLLPSERAAGGVAAWAGATPVLGGMRRPKPARRQSSPRGSLPPTLSAKY